MLTMIVIIVLVIGLQYFLKYFLGQFGIPVLSIELIIDFILAIIYAFMNYPGVKKDAIKDARFHQSVLTYFCVLLLITIMFYFWF